MKKARLDSFVIQTRKALDDRVNHWCLFTVTERVKSRLGEAQFPGIFHDQFVLPSDQEVKKRLKTWSSIVKVAAIFSEFDQLRADSRLVSESKRFRSCVWAKPFLEQVVYGGVSGLQSLKNSSFSYLDDRFVDEHESPRRPRANTQRDFGLTRSMFSLLTRRIWI